MASPRDPELTKLLVQELERHLVTLEAGAEGTSDLPSEAAVEQTRRTVHALKGSAGLAGEPELASAMQRLERRLREGDSGALGAAIETVKLAIGRLSLGERAIDGGWPVPPADLRPGPIDPIVRAQYVEEVTDRLAKIDDELSRASDAVEAATAIYRHVHTMKGAASAAGDEPMAWFCHGLEETIRSGGGSRDEAFAALEAVAKYRAVLGGLLDDPEAALATLRGVPLRSRPPHRASTRTGSWDDDPRALSADGTIRVAEQSVDQLLDHVGAIAMARERVSARVASTTDTARTMRKLRGDLVEALRLIGPPRPWGAPAAALRRIERASQSIGQLVDQLDRDAEALKSTDQALRDGAGSAKKLLGTMRQTPIRGMFARLAAAALAEAKRTGRLVAIRTVGADELVDRRLIEQLTEPCMHFARNAIAHGIEPPEEREALGKPREATITFSASWVSGHRLAIAIADDGAGVDVAAVRARAVATGAVTDVLAEVADDQTLLELLFLPGVSTRGQSPDLLAGRGIGLDIGLSAVQKLGGTIRLSSRRGQGFEARVDVPVETGLATVLWVTAGGLEHAIPAANARRVRINDADNAPRVPHLAACLEARAPTSIREPSSLAFERAPFAIDLEVDDEGAEGVSIGVDIVGSTEEVLVRELSPLLWGIGPYAGAIVRGDGSVRLALDVHTLLPRARALGRVPEGRVSEAPSRPPRGSGSERPR